MPVVRSELNENIGITLGNYGKKNLFRNIPVKHTSFFNKTFKIASIFNQLYNCVNKLKTKPMVDRTVEFYDLFMLYSDLSRVNEIELPSDYSYRFFDGSDEDIQHWIDIVVSSGDAKTQEEGKQGFETYYRPHLEELSKRCIFIINNEGLPIGTSTAFFIVNPQPGLPKISENPEALPEEVTGHLHWVSIREEYKRRGLSKPMITRTMKIMYELGHKSAFLHTQTPSWLACKIYLDLGWQPFRFVLSEADFKKGWGIVYNKIASIK